MFNNKNIFIKLNKRHTHRRANSANALSSLCYFTTNNYELVSKHGRSYLPYVIGYRVDA